MTLDLRTILAVALIVGGFLLPQGGEIVVPTPAPVPVEVSVDLPVADIPREDREDLAGFYDAMADAVKNDGDKGGEKLIKDTADFRERHVAALVTVVLDSIRHRVVEAREVVAVFAGDVGNGEIDADLDRNGSRRGHHNLAALRQ